MTMLKYSISKEEITDLPFIQCSSFVRASFAYNINTHSLLPLVEKPLTKTLFASTRGFGSLYFWFCDFLLQVGRIAGTLCPKE